MREPQPLLRAPHVGFDLFQLLPRGRELLAELVLLLRQDIEWNRAWVGEVIGNELTSLTEDVVDLAAVTSCFALAIARRESEQLDQSRQQFGHPFGVELDLPQVVLGDVPLDPVRGQVRQLARVPFVTCATDEVVVLDAMAAGALGEDQPPPADPAVDRALEVVLVLPLLLAGTACAVSTCCTCSNSSGVTSFGWLPSYCTPRNVTIPT